LGRAGPFGLGAVIAEGRAAMNAIRISSTILLLASGLLAATGCSSKPSVGHGSAADTNGGPNASNCQPAQTIQTGTGNSFTATLCIGQEVTNADDSYSYPNVVTITYVDMIQPPYFGAGTQQIHAWIQADLTTAFHSGDPNTSSQQQQTFDLTLPPDSDTTGTFAGSVTYQLGGYISDTQTDLTGIDIAFFDDHGNWDSNYGGNYHVSFE
jgi:hypothetical protein